jgi:ABC-2 type transport system permease protein
MFSSEAAIALKGVGAVIYREMRLFFGNKATIVLSVMTPLIYMLLFSTSLSKMMPMVNYNGVSVSYIEFVLPGHLVMSVLSTALMTSQSVFNEKISNMLLEILSTPVQHKAYMIGKMFASTSLALIQSMLIFLCGILVFRVPLSFVRFLGVLALNTLVCVIISGFYMTVMGLIKQFRTFIMTANILTNVIMFASSIFYPAEQIAPGLRLFAKISPVTYCSDAIRSFFLLGNVPRLLMLLIIGLAVCFTVTSVTVFRKRFAEV